VPSLEFEADTKVEGQARDVYALAPALYKGLSKSGHVAFALGENPSERGSNLRLPDWCLSALGISGGRPLVVSSSITWHAQGER